VHSLVKSDRLLPEGMIVQWLAAATERLTIHAENAEPSARCPDCSRDARRLHSRYQRRIADLPWRGISITIQVHARRFFCDELSCERRIFCERLPKIAARSRSRDRRPLPRPVSPRAVHVQDLRREGRHLCEALLEEPAVGHGLWWAPHVGQRPPVWVLGGGLEVIVVSGMGK